MPAFVPPFIKSAKTETGKDPAPKENARVPTFVPPFKKQKTVTQDRSSKQHKVENQHHQPLEQPKSSTYVPPAQKPKGTTDVTALAGTTKANTMNKQSVPVNCASVSSGAEESYVDVPSSKNQGTEFFLNDVGVNEIIYMNYEEYLKSVFPIDRDASES